MRVEFRFEFGQTLRDVVTKREGSAIGFCIDRDGVRHVDFQWVDKDGDRKNRWLPERDLRAIDEFGVVVSNCTVAEPAIGKCVGVKGSPATAENIETLGRQERGCESTTARVLAKFTMDRQKLLIACRDAIVELERLRPIPDACARLGVAVELAEQAI